MVFITLLGAMALPLYVLGTAAEPSDQALPEPVGQGVRTLSYIASARSSFLHLNAIFRIAIPLLLVLPILAVFHVLRETARKIALLATVSAGLSILGSIALAQVGYSLVGLSDQFTMASAEVDKAATVASANGLIGTLGLGEAISGVLLFSWILATSLLFQSKHLFRRWVAVLGIFAALGTLHGSGTILATIVGMSWSAFFFSYLVFTPFFFVFLVWSSVLGYNIYTMGTKETTNPSLPQKTNGAKFVLSGSGGVPA